MPEIIVKLGERIIQRYYFEKDVLNVGRARDNDIVIENLSVSRNHARIKHEHGKYFLTDMNSANGTLVNGVRITKTELFHDDQVAVGKHVLQFVDTEEAPEQADAPPAQGPPGGVAEKPAEAGQLEGQIGILAVTKGKQAGQEFRVYKQETFIGRASENDIRIHDWFVSKKHAMIRREGDQFILKDLDSWRGTTANGNSVREARLQEGDEIIFGTTVLSFRVVDAEEYAALHPSIGSGVEAGIESDESWATDSSSSYRVLNAVEQVEEDKIEEEIERPETKAEEEPLELEEEEDSFDPDDEFAPMSTEELEALERGEGVEIERDEDEEDRRLAWEMIEAEKMFEMSGEPDRFSLAESHQTLEAEENAAVDVEGAAEGLRQRAEAPPRPEAEVAVEDEEEKAALEGQDDGEPLVEGGKKPEADGAKAAEIQMWEKALKNKSAVIRKNAARELKKLTGKDYDWQSGPEGS